MIVLVALVAGLVVGVATPAAAQPEPSVTIDPDPVEGMIGSEVTVSLSFDNTGTEPGFGPYLDLRLPAGGADGDDGITFVSATYLGVPVSSTVIDCPDGGGTVTHPLTGLDVDCPDGQQLVVLQVPFGSFTPDQPPAPIEVTFEVSPNADIDVPLDFTVTPGFMFGDSPTGTPQEGTPSTGTYQPVPGTFQKSYTGPEDETATGPNFPRTYRLVGDLPDGQTATGVTITDLLPPSLAFLAVTSVTPASGVVEAEPPSGVPSLPPDNEISVTFDSVTGTDAPEDVVVEFTAFVPEVGADGAPVIDPTSGAPVPVRDDGATSGTFVPLDPRDPDVPFTIDPEDVTVDDHVLTARSLATQKTATPLSADGNPEPGGQVEYTLRVQVSDFFSFEPVVLDDVLGDGLEIDLATPPTFTVTEHDVVTTGTFTPGADLIVDETQHTCGDGTTGLSFDLSDALVSPPPGGPDGRLDGGRVGGTFGPTVAEITFTANILDAYRCATGGEPAIDPGDPLANDVTVGGDVLDPDTGTPTGGSPTDGSSADLVIDEPIITKQVVARNGELLDPADGVPEFVAGDEITFGFTFPLGSTDMEQLTFTDFFPLPAIEITDTPTYIDETCGIPAPDTVCLGPDDTFSDTEAGVDPTFTADPAGNSVTANYGTFDNPDNPASVIELVYTALIQDEPFRDGLLLVNQLQSTYTTTDGDVRSATDVAEFQVNGPALNVTKGVVGSTNPNATFTGGPQQPAGAATFAGPVVADCADSIVGGDITSADRGGAPDADAEGVDAGDILRFAMVVENTGHGLDGAFDVVVGDTLPEGFQVPAGGLNLCVTDGTGAEFDFTADGMFTAAGGTPGPLAGTIDLDDPGPTAHPGGGLDPPADDLSSGRNLVVVSYELEATDELVALGEATNTATIDNFAANEGGANYVPVELPSNVTDDAVVTAAAPAVAKSVVATDQAHSTGTNVAIGETVQYEVVITVPEGELPDATLVDTLPAGLAMVSVDAVTATPGLDTSVAGGFDAVADAAQAGLATPGDEVTFDFGTLTDTDRDDGVAEQITLTYTVIVLDVAGNQQSTSLPNSAVFSFAGESLAPVAAAVTVAEPAVTVTKTPSPTGADAGDTITYSVEVANTGASTLDAFDVALVDLVPPEATYVSGTLAAVSGPPPTSLSDAGAPILTATWDVLPLGQVARLEYQVTLSTALEAPSIVENTATATWSSLPGIAEPTSPFNADGRQRTGAGGVDDYTTTDTAEVQVLGLSFEKAVNSTSEPDTADPAVTIGEQITYDIQVSPAEGLIDDLTITDAVPAGLSVDPASVQVLTTAGSGTPPFDLTADFNGTLPAPVVTGGGADDADVVVTFAGQTVVTPDNDATNNAFVVRFTATVLDVTGNVGLPPDETVLENVATVSAEGTPPLATSTVANPVVEPRLAIGKEVDPTTAEQGDTVTLSITVTNTGTSTAYGVLVEDELPPEYVATSVVEVATPDGFTLTQTGSLLSYQGGDIPAGDAVTFEVTASLQPDLAVGTVVTNTATASEATSLPGDADGERTVPTVTADASLNVIDADLAITKTDNDVVVAPGDTQTYDITVRNAGGATATGVSITDTLPPSTTFVSVTGTDCTGTAVGSTVTITIGVDIVSGGEVTCALTVTIDNPLPAGVTAFENTATVAYDGDDDDPTPGNNTATDTDTKDPAATPDLVVAKDDGETEVAPGQTLTYAVTVTNVGTAGATNVQVTDTIPTDTTFVSCATPTGTVTVPCAFDATTGTVTTTYSPLAGGGGTATLEVTVEVNDPLPAAVEEITNEVTATDDGANGPDPTPDDNTDTDTDTVDASPDMSIVKVPDASLVVPGQTYGYDLTVANGGDQDATGVTVEDTVPDGLTVDCATVDPDPVSCDASTGEIVWGPPISPTGPADPWPAGEAAVFSYDVTVDNPAAAGTESFTNTATVADDGANGIDPTPDNNESSATTNLDIGPGRTQPDLSVVKDDGALTAAPGDTLDYDVVVTNSGNIGATGVLVTDTLPPGTTFAACATDPPVACAETPAGSGVVTATFPVVAGGGGEVTLTISVVVDSPQPTGVEELTNVVEVTDDGANGPEPTPDDNTDDDTDVLEATPDLDVTKDDGPQIRLPGEEYTYTLTVRNKGDQEATGVVVTDRIPPGTTFVSCDPTCAETDGTVTWEIASLLGGADDTPPGPGSSVELTLTVQVDDPVPAGILVLRNDVTVADDGANGPDPTPADNLDSDIDLLLAGPDLAVTKGDGVDTVAPGDTVTYAITAENLGLQDATGVVVTDTLPAGLTFVSCDPACDSSALPEVTWELDELASGDSATFELVATVDDPAAAGLDEVTNLVTITDDGTNGPDRNPADNSDMDTDTLDAVPDLVVGKDDGLDRVEGGENVTYTVTVSNVGDQDATGVVVTDTLPPGTTFESCTASCDPAAAPDITWTIGDLGAGDEVTLEVTVTVDDPVADGTTEYINTAGATDDGTNGPDPTPDDNTDTDTDTYGADLAVTKDDGVETVTPGETVTYTITVTNNGPSDVDTVVLTDTAPPELTDLSFTPADGEYDPATGEWTGLALAAGDTVTMELTATVDPAARRELTNTVDVELPAGFTDPTPDNNTDDDTDTLSPAADVTIDKDGPATAMIGDQVTYTIVVANPGPSDATDVVVTDPVPDGTTFVSGSGDGWTCTGTTTVSCALDGPLAPGAGSTLELTFEAEAAGEIVNVAEVTTNECNCDQDDARTNVAVATTGGSGFIPFTGAEVMRLLLAALVLLGLGASLVAWRRARASSYDDGRA